MKNITPLLLSTLLVLVVVMFAAPDAAQAGKKEFYLSIGHGGTSFGYGHGGGYLGIHLPGPAYCPTPPVYSGGYVWMPGYWIGHGDHAHYIPGRYVWQDSYCPY